MIRIHQIGALFDLYNAMCFDNKLPTPTIRDTRNDRLHGQVLTTSNSWKLTMHINRNDTLDNIAETIYHECVHIFVDSVLQLEDTAMHGPEYCKVYNENKPCIEWADMIPENDDE